MMVGRWCVQLAAMWHWYLPLCIYKKKKKKKKKSIVSVHSFFIFFLHLVYRYIRRNGRRYQHVLASCALLTGVILKGLTLRKFVSDVCVCMFYVCEVIVD